jgi:LysR family transcriptional regulator, regulator of abg operon
MRDPEAALIARLRFRHLELIRSLGATGSLRKTANAMNLSQPAISKALVEIESSFGFHLFERSPAGVAVTLQGQAVLEGATLLLNGLRHVRRAALHAERRVLIRMGVTPFLSVTLVPRLLWTLRKQGDEASVSLREGRGPQMFELFRSGELDALLVAVPSDLVQSQPAVAMTMKPLFEEGLAVVAAVDHPLASRRRVSWRDLLGERWILPQAPSAVEEAIRSAFVSQGLVPPRPWIESMPPLTNIELVAAGHGISAVPSSLARAARGRGLISELRIEPKGRLPPVSFIFRSAEAESPAIRALSQALEARGLL